MAAKHSAVSSVMTGPPICDKYCDQPRGMIGNAECGMEGGRDYVRALGGVKGGKRGTGDRRGTEGKGNGGRGRGTGTRNGTGRKGK